MSQEFEFKPVCPTGYGPGTCENCPSLDKCAEAGFAALAEYLIAEGVIVD